MVTGCNLPGPVGPVCGGFARRTGVWRDVSRRRGEVAVSPNATSEAMTASLGFFRVARIPTGVEGSARAALPETPKHGQLGEFTKAQQKLDGFKADSKIKKGVKAVATVPERV